MYKEFRFEGSTPEQWAPTQDLRDYLLGGGFEVIDAGLLPPAQLGKILPRIFMGSKDFLEFARS
jgi:hypothetical protein